MKKLLVLAALLAVVQSRHWRSSGHSIDPVGNAEEKCRQMVSRSSQNM